MIVFLEILGLLKPYTLLESDNLFSAMKNISVDIYSVDLNETTNSS